MRHVFNIAPGDIQLFGYNPMNRESVQRFANSIHKPEKGQHVEVRKLSSGAHYVRRVINL